MLHQTTSDMPVIIRDNLSESWQELYQAAFNSALQWYGEESKAHRIAQSAVRSQAASATSVISN